MPASDILLTALKSRLVRRSVTQNDSGLRSVGGAPPPSFLPDWLSNLVGGFFKAVVNFGGWLIGVVFSGIGFTFTGIWGLIVSTSAFIYNFNWNATDAELNAQVNALQQILYGQLGATLGNAVGYLVCGVVPSAGMMVFNEALGLYLLKEVGEEAFEEFAANLAVLIRLSINVAARHFLISAFKNVRRAVKTYLRDPDSPQSTLIRNLFGGGIDEAIRGWGAEGAKPWSFRIGVENAIDRIENPALREFTEEFIEEALDGCVEAGYIIAQGLDSWVLQQRMAKTHIMGSERVVEVTPNREVPEEKIILAGRETLLRPELTATMRSHSLIDKRDVGQWVGEPIREAVRRPPISIQIKISLNSVQRSPFIEQNGKRGTRVSVTIPNVDRAKIDWQTIKTAAGGANGYLWGRYMAKAKLTDGYVMKLYAATPQEAEDRVRAYLLLSNSTLEGLTITEEAKEGTRLTYDALYKQPTRIYPIEFTIVNQVRVLNEDSGRAALSGIYKSKKYLIPLNVDRKPDNFEAIVNDLFYIPGANG